MYGICIVTGIILAVYMGTKEGRKLGIYSDFVYYGVIIIVPLSIIGARLWYVLFNLDQKWTLSEILGFNGGLSGLAIQGAVIVAFISAIIYAKISKVKIYRVFDIVAPGFFVGQILGRWGNFFNKELYGPIVQNEKLFKGILPRFITENMYIGGDYHHPTFLYESTLNFIGLMLMLVLRRKSKRLKSGDFLGIYLVWYGAVRIFTEALRAKSGASEVLLFMGVQVSTAISVLFIVGGAMFLLIKRFVGKQEKYFDILEGVKNNKIDTVLFDLDGTLLDTKELIDRSFVHTFNKYLPEHVLTDEELNSFMGPTLVSSFSRFESDPKKVEEMCQYYRQFNVENHDVFTKVFFGAKDLVRILKKRGYNIGIVSSKKKDIVMKGLAFSKLDKYFDVVIAYEDVKNHKPDPEGILKALTNFSNAKNILYVGDAVTDIEAGKRANIKTCGVLYSSHSEELIKCEPNYLVHNLNGILKLLGE